MNKNLVWCHPIHKWQSCPGNMRIKTKLTRSFLRPPEWWNLADICTRIFCKAIKPLISHLMCLYVFAMLHSSNMCTCWHAPMYICFIFFSQILYLWEEWDLRNNYKMERGRHACLKKNVVLLNVFHCINKSHITIKINLTSVFVLFI